MINHEQFRTRVDLIAASDTCISEIVERYGRAHVVVPNHMWADQRKLLLRSAVPVGANVLTHEQLVANMWEVFGDGTQLVTSQQRYIIVRTIAEQLKMFEYVPSTKFVKELARFVADACIDGLTPEDALSPSESKVMELVSLYERELELKGLIELAQVHERIDEAAFSGQGFVYENPEFSSVHAQRFLERVGSVAEVCLLEQVVSPALDTPQDDELSAVHGLLFSGAGGLEARGHVVAAEAAGYHAQAGLIARRTSDLIAQGARPSDIVITLNSPSDAYPALHDALAAARVPFATEFSLPVARTGLGGAFCELMALERDPEGPQSYERMADVLGTPYSGVSGEDARAQQAWWRARACSTPEERTDNLTRGYAAGAATSTFVREHLGPFAELLKAPLAERVKLMFQHAHEAHIPIATLVDDRAAAETILDYLDQCEALGAVPNVDDIGNEMVTLARGYRQEEGPLLIVGASSVGLASVPHVIMPHLDSDHYPMAAAPSALDTLRSKLGLLAEDTTARDARLLLLNLLESSQQTFTCERSTRNSLAEESCASALYEELMAVYRSEEENDPEKPLGADKIPAALKPYQCVTSEWDEFFADYDESLASRGVNRGVMHDEAAVKLLTHRESGEERPYSPTQIEDYYRCPYRWFTSRRVGYSALDGEFDQSALGTLFHDAMARFYAMLKEAGHARVTPDNLSEALEVAEAAFSAQLEESKDDVRKRVFVRTMQDEMRVEELHDTFISFVGRDATFLPGFTPTYFELSIGGSSDSPITYAGVSVRGKVDRIDVDDSGRAVIIDYKLSGLSTGYGLEQDAEGQAYNKHIQTDIYALIVQRHFEALGQDIRVVGSVYRSYTKNTLRGAYEASIDWGVDEQAAPMKDALPLAGSSEDYPSYVSRVEQAVAQRLGRLEEGYIAADPIEDDACAYCLALPFCPLKGAM